MNQINNIPNHIGTSNSQYRHKFSIESAGGPNINYDFMNSDDNISENEPLETSSDILDQSD